MSVSGKTEKAGSVLEEQRVKGHDSGGEGVSLSWVPDLGNTVKVDVVGTPWGHWIVDFMLENSFDSFFSFNDGNKKNIRMMLFPWDGKLQGKRIHSLTRRMQVWAPVLALPLPACDNGDPLWSVPGEPVSAAGTGTWAAHLMKLSSADCARAGEAAARG